MTRIRTIAALMSLALVSVATGAGAEKAEPAFMAAVFPPELIMQHGRTVGLRPEQREAILEAVRETQATTLEFQWAMQEAAQELNGLMSQNEIDEPAALDTAKRVMDLEGKVKRAHLRLLIRIKSELDPDQQAALRRLRAGN